MRVINSSIIDVKIIEPDVHQDVRGYFCETYNRERYCEFGITDVFVQDNESLSMKGVVRGLHWQTGEHAQAKLLRVIRGSVWDVAVDIRRGSPTFGRHVSAVLSAENGHQLYVPRGFAHGFIVLEDNTLLSYKCDNVYCPAAERGMRFDDPVLGIEWPKIGVRFVLSEKDKKHPFFAEIELW